MTVFLHGLEVYAYHGCSAAEQELGHRYLIDIDVEARDDSQFTDQITDAVDYARLGFLVQEVVLAEKHNTVEIVARKALTAIFREFDRAESATIRIAKRFPPAPLIAEFVGVSLHLRRDQLDL
jgi:dihydroneopterin aldolase